MADNAAPADRDAMAAHLGAVVASGGRVSGPNANAIRETLMLTASLPDLDYDAFCAATALILADGLQGGGQDNLFWHWDAFQSHYALADRPVRAAILQGFLTGAATGRFTVDPLPHRTIATSEPIEGVTGALRGLVADFRRDDVLRDTAAATLRELTGKDGVSPSEVWGKNGHAILKLETAEAESVTRGIRHIFERDAAFDPGADAALLPPVAENRRDTAKRA